MFNIIPKKSISLMTSIELFLKVGSLINNPLFGIPKVVQKIKVLTASSSEFGLKLFCKLNQMLAAMEFQRNKGIFGPVKTLKELKTLTNSFCSLETTIIPCQSLMIVIENSFSHQSLRNSTEAFCRMCIMLTKKYR